MSSVKSNYLAWIQKAENDFLNIKNNTAVQDVPWDTVCFHAQQAAEKLLKGFLIYHAQPLVRTHDLVAWLAICAAIDSSLSSLQNDCRRLSYYAVAVRYPDEVCEPDESDGRGRHSGSRCHCGPSVVTRGCCRRIRTRGWQ